MLDMGESLGTCGTRGSLLATVYQQLRLCQTTAGIIMLSRWYEPVSPQQLTCTMHTTLHNI